MNTTLNVYLGDYFKSAIPGECASRCAVTTSSDVISFGNPAKNISVWYGPLSIPNSRSQIQIFVTVAASSRLPKTFAEPLSFMLQEPRNHLSCREEPPHV